MRTLTSNLGAKVTEIGLIPLLKGCPDLHPDGITADGEPIAKGDLFLEAVVKLRPDIAKISLDPECTSLSDKGLVALVSNY